MLENFLSPEVFKNGVTEYLKTFKYENAETRDLWASLQKAANASGQEIDVARIMDTWTLQMGLPVITVEFNSVSKLATLTQSRFLATPEETPSKQKRKNIESPYG
jgi:aminopeptidase N